MAREKKIKEEFRELDPYRSIPKINVGLSISVLVLVLIVLFLVATVYVLKEPKVIVLRLYDNIQENNTVIVDDRYKNELTQKDFYRLINHFITHYDFKSTDALKNYRAMLKISEDKFLEDLKTIETQLISRETHGSIKYVENVLNDFEISRSKKENLTFHIKINYTQTILYKNGEDEEQKKELTVALKAVNRMTYFNNLDLGGWYYGLVVSHVSDAIDHI